MIHLSVTCPDEETARRLAEAAIAERLAACATMAPGLTSLFHWEGAVAEEPEVALVFKTTETCRAALAARIAALHPYDLPVITWERLGTTAAAAAWLRAETRGDGDGGGGLSPRATE